MGVETAAADRLPWLADEPAPKVAKSRRSNVLPWAAATVLLVAAGGFWMGQRSIEPTTVPATRQARQTTTVQLPPARSVAPEVSIAPAQEVRPSPSPEVRPTPTREVHITAPSQPKAADHSTSAAPAEEASAPEQPETQTSPPGPAKVAGPAPTPSVIPKPWNPRVFVGAAGRVVQIGAFGSVTQAKHGWWYMVRDYPAMAHLPAVVRPTRNSKGRVFYRFQVGTTSQAHSEVLCQRMQRIKFSCAVVDLPWKAKVER